MKVLILTALSTIFSYRLLLIRMIRVALMRWTKTIPCPCGFTPKVRRNRIFLPIRRFIREPCQQRRQSIGLMLVPSSTGAGTDLVFFDGSHNSTDSLALIESGIALRNWHHLAMTFDAANAELAFYIDGSPEAVRR